MGSKNHKSISETPVTEIHPFKPFVPKEIKYLILGSFPGKGQTEIKLPGDTWFYGAKRNTFWKIMEVVYETELKSTIEKQKLFTSLGLGITDIILKAARIKDSNADDNLQIIEYNEKAIRSILASYTIETVFFTSQFVYKIFKKLFPGFSNTIVLPSPSPRYARMSLKEKAAFYKKVLPKK